MDYSASFAISAAGMTAERARVDIAALNLANANTIQGADGANYQPLRAVMVSAQAGGGSAFADQVEQGIDDSGLSGGMLNVPQVSVEANGTEPRMVYEPSNPFANGNGFVAYAAVDSATEMLTMMSAMRSYEANVAAMNMAKNLALKALDIGGASS